MDTPVYKMEKVCSQCEISKPHIQFSKLSTKNKSGSYYRRNICKECISSNRKNGKPGIIEITEKQCSKCLEVRSRQYFTVNRNNKHGLRNTCKSCDIKVRKERERSNPDYIKNKKRSELLWRYGLTEIEYKDLLEKQNYNCAICKLYLEKPQIDHCHNTKIVRGILCSSCNLLLGNAKDSINTLKSAIKYLEKYNA